MEIATPLPATARNDGSSFRLPVVFYQIQKRRRVGILAHRQTAGLNNKYFQAA